MSLGPSRPDRDILRLVHHHPGRLRLRSEAFQDEDAAALRARDALVASGAVLRVEHDAETGSLLVEYEPGRIPPDTILERAAEAAGLELDLEGARRPDRTHGEHFLQACRRINEAAYEMTGFRVEPRTLLPIGVGALSAVFFVMNRGQRMPRWDNLAYWSLSLFAMLHGREIGAMVSVRGDAKPGDPGPDAARSPR